jgi:hypothetical protein
VGCKQVVDPSNVLKKGVETSRASVGAANVAGGYQSRYQGRDAIGITGPKTAASFGGNVLSGYVFCAAAGLGAAAAFGFLGANYLRLPLIAAFVVGWVIRRTLALGSGGGTPDRGFFGSIFLLLVVVASFFVLRWFDYRGAAAVRSPRYDEMYGMSAAAAAANPDAAIVALKARAGEDKDVLTLRSDKSEIIVSTELDRLRSAKATRKSPKDGYDLELLAATGKPGFEGHLANGVKRGETVRFTPSSSGIRLSAPALIALWVFEFIVLLGMSFRRID